MTQHSLAADTAFVDREKEVDSLSSFFEQTLSGHGCTVFVTGDAGIGKTRMMREFRKHVELKGSIFLEGSCYEEEGSVPYSPWIDIIRGMAKGAGSSRLRKHPRWVVEEIGRLVPSFLSAPEEIGIKGWLRGPSSSLMMAPSTDQDRVRLFQAVTDFLTGETKVSVVIFLDDIGWADQASLQLFNYLSRRVRELKVMLIGAYREVEVPDNHSLGKIVLDLNRQRISHHVSLTRFTSDHVSQLLATQLRGHVSCDLGHLVYSRTSGNPFFVEEVARSLNEGGLLQRTEAGLTVRDLQRLEIPNSVRAVIKQRIGHLSNECAQFLSIAALAGREFDFKLVQRASELSEDKSIGLLETALTAQLIGEKRDGGKVFYVFIDEQIRDVLADQVSLLRRRKYHVAIGQAIEDAYKDEIQDHLEELAYHYVQGGDARKARDYSIKAGERSARLYAHSDSTKHFLNALELVGKDEQEAKLDLLMRLAREAYAMSNHEDVLRFGREAADIGRGLGLKTRLADAYGLMGISHFILADSKGPSLDNLHRGLDALEGLGASLQEAILCQHLGRVYALTGEPALGQQWVKRSIEVASKIGTNEILADAYQTLAVTLPLEEKEAALCYYEKALNIALEHKLEDPACRAYNNLAWAYAGLKGNYKRSEELLLKGIEYAKAVGYLENELFLRSEICMDTYFPMGEWKASERIAFELMRPGEASGPPLAIALIALALIAVSKGELEKAKRFLDDAHPIMMKAERVEGLAVFHRALGALHIAQSQVDKAEQDLVKAFEFGKKVSLTPSKLDVAFDLILIELIKGKLEDAWRYYGELRQMASELGEDWGYAFDRWAKGLITGAEGKTDDAIALLRESVGLWKTVARPLQLARCCVDLARLENKAGNLREAENSLDVARRIFEQLEIPAKFGLGSNVAKIVLR